MAKLRIRIRGDGLRTGKVKKIRRKDRAPTNLNPSPKDQWKKGQSGNPSGRPPETVTRRELRKFTRASIAELYNKLIEMNKDALRELAQSETVPMIECIIAAALLEDRLNGTVTNTDKILDRAIGRVATELTGLEGAPLVPPAINFIPVAVEEAVKDIPKEK